MENQTPTPPDLADHTPECAPECADDYDSPWKDAVERYFPEFMAFYFPAAYARIDWSAGHEFLDQELRAVVQDAELGKRLVDKLARVILLSGTEDWIYLHVEVQGSPRAEFAERMFVYNYRLFDRYHRPVASMAVLADQSEGWHPTSFGFEVLGCAHTLKFPTAKLLDFAGRETELQAEPNPFALVTLAHLLSKATRQDMAARFAAKWKLIQLLYQRRWDKQRIIDLFVVLDWMMRLPEHLAQELWQNIDILEEQEQMRYVSSVERIGIEKGREQGLQQGEALALQRLLRKRFGAIPSEISARIAAASLSEIEGWFDQAIEAGRIDDVFGPTAH